LRHDGLGADVSVDVGVLVEVAEGVGSSSVVVGGGVLAGGGDDEVAGGGDDEVAGGGDDEVAGGGSVMGGGVVEVVEGYVFDGSGSFKGGGALLDVGDVRGVYVGVVGVDVAEGELEAGTRNARTVTHASGDVTEVTDSARAAEDAVKVLEGAPGEPVRGDSVDDGEAGDAAPLEGTALAGGGGEVLHGPDEVGVYAARGPVIHGVNAGDCVAPAGAGPGIVHGAGPPVR
jgi:hypothetical protein